MVSRNSSISFLFIFKISIYNYSIDFSGVLCSYDKANNWMLFRCLQIYREQHFQAWSRWIHDRLRRWTSKINWRAISTIEVARLLVSFLRSSTQKFKKIWFICFVQRWHWGEAHLQITIVYSTTARKSHHRWLQPNKKKSFWKQSGASFAKVFQLFWIILAQYTGERVTYLNIFHYFSLPKNK